MNSNPGNSALLQFHLRNPKFYCISLGSMWIRKNGVMEHRGAGAPGNAAGAGNRAGRAGLLFALLLVMALGDGCKKSAPPPSLLPLLPAPVETVARIHWLGIKRLASETNAANFMAIWNLAESKKLETQTLDRLAMGLVASNQVAATGKQSSVISDQSSVTSNQLSVISNHCQCTPFTPSPITSQPNQAPIPAHRRAALLRPLLDDLLQQESFVEVRQATNQPGEWPWPSG